MPHINSRGGGDDLASTDEVKVYNDEGAEDVGDRSPEKFLIEDKLVLVKETEQDKSTVPGRAFSVASKSPSGAAGGAGSAAGAGGGGEDKSAGPPPANDHTNNLSYFYRPYANGATSLSTAAKVPAISFPHPGFVYGDLMTQPPPAHSGIQVVSPFPFHKGGLPRSAMFPNQYSVYQDFVPGWPGAAGYAMPPVGGFHAAAAAAPYMHYMAAAAVAGGLLPPHPALSPHSPVGLPQSALIGQGLKRESPLPHHVYDAAAMAAAAAAAVSRFPSREVFHTLASTVLSCLHAPEYQSSYYVADVPSSPYRSMNNGLGNGGVSGNASAASSSDLTSHGGNGSGRRHSDGNPADMAIGLTGASSATSLNCQVQTSAPAEKKPRVHIKKPLNAFMLFMKEMRAKVVSECTLKESAAINQILGRKWHALDRAEQAKYYDMAKKEREQHMKLYPGWSARDNYAMHSKKKKKQPQAPHGKEGGRGAASSAAAAAAMASSSGVSSLSGMSGASSGSAAAELLAGESGKDCIHPKKCRARFGLDKQNQWCKPCRRKKKCILQHLSDAQAHAAAAGSGAVDSLLTDDDGCDASVEAADVYNSQVSASELDDSNGGEDLVMDHDDDDDGLDACSSDGHPDADSFAPGMAACSAAAELLRASGVGRRTGQPASTAVIASLAEAARASIAQPVDRTRRETGVSGAAVLESDKEL